MQQALIFYILLLGCCSYALWRGGAPERWAAALQIVAVILAGLPQLQTGAECPPYDLSPRGFLVDGAFLVALYAIALTADRFWPMAAAGLQTANFIVHLGKLFAPDVLPLGYGLGLAPWIYPKLVLFAIGAWRHQQRLARYGADPSWSPSRSPREILQNA